MKYDISERLIWLKGRLVHVNDAKINVLTPASQFGLNVFEGIPCYWNEDENQLYAFRLEAHYDRLMRSARILQVNCRYTEDEMREAFMSVIRANDYREDISVRQTLFIDGFGSWGSDGPLEMFIAPIPKRNTSSEYNKKGLNCCISSYRRISDDDLSPHVKCGANYINSRLGQREALRNGYDTCIFLNKYGQVSEGPGSCFFMVNGGRLITPSLTDCVLESITRDSIIKLARANDIPVIERSIDRTELYTCEEAFLCGSSMEVTPVLSIDRYETGHGQTITQRIHELYLEAARGRIADFKDWVTPVY